MPETDEGQNPSGIRIALDRILASPGFDKSEQLKSFLRFVVEETLAGRGEQIKAYTIALDALGRDADFNPQLDPIVRVVAGRLRHALENYYAAEGRDDSVVIELPVGHYTPLFRPNDPKGARRGVIARLRGLRRKPTDTDMRTVPPWTTIHAAVDRIIASAAFGKSPQLAQFLRFVVEETLAGRGEQIKAYTIAVDALGRGSSFDPQADPIVRVEAGRLRRALKSYYAGEGQNDPIVIELPRGGYVADIRSNIAPRRSLTARIRDDWRRVTVTLQKNYRLILMVVVIAAIVSAVLDLIMMQWMAAKLQEFENPPLASPALGDPSSTGGLAR